MNCQNLVLFLKPKLYRFSLHCLHKMHIEHCKGSIPYQLSSIKISETSNRLTVRNLIKIFLSIFCYLITNADYHLLLQMCLSKTDAVAAVNRCTHTHTLSLCLSAILLFSPFFPFDIKTLATILSSSIEIQISTYSLVLISKVSSI
jgi:hypothetical protein